MHSKRKKEKSKEKRIEKRNKECYNQNVKIRKEETK